MLFGGGGSGGGGPPDPRGNCGVSVAAGTIFAGWPKRIWRRRAISRPYAMPSRSARAMGTTVSVSRGPTYSNASATSRSLIGLGPAGAVPPDNTGMAGRSPTHVPLKGMSAGSFHSSNRLSKSSYPLTALVPNTITNVVAPAARSSFSTKPGPAGGRAKCGHPSISSARWCFVSTSSFTTLA